MLKSAYCISFLKIIILLIFSCSEKFSAQSFKLLRYDENYEFLKDSADTFYNKVKFLPLNEKKGT